MAGFRSDPTSVVFELEMNTGTIMRHGVRFRGPLLTHRTRDALSTAGISLLERSPLPGWNGQVIEYVVMLGARDEEDAIARVREVVSRDGSYGEFASDPP
jgi:hypothetical protein